jgi:hypothetical protein
MNVHLRHTRDLRPVRCGLGWSHRQRGVVRDAAVHLAHQLLSVVVREGTSRGIEVREREANRGEVFKRERERECVYVLERPRVSIAFARRRRRLLLSILLLTASCSWWIGPLERLMRMAMVPSTLKRFVFCVHTVRMCFARVRSQWVWCSPYVPFLPHFLTNAYSMTDTHTHTHTHTRTYARSLHAVLLAGEKVPRHCAELNHRPKSHPRDAGGALLAHAQRHDHIFATALQRPTGLFA